MNQKLFPVNPLDPDIHNIGDDLISSTDMLIKAFEIKKDRDPFKESHFIEPVLSHFDHKALNPYRLSLINHKPIVVYPEYDFSEFNAALGIPSENMGYTNPDLRKLIEVSITIDFWKEVALSKPDPIIFLCDRYAVPSVSRKLPRKAKKAFINSFGRLAYQTRYRKKSKPNE